MPRLLSHLLERWIAEPIRKVDADSLAYRLSDQGRHFDYKVPAVLIAAAVCLIIQNYTSHPTSILPVARLVANLLGGPAAVASVESTLHKWSGDSLSLRIWWALDSAVTYALIPLLIVKGAFRERWTDYGLKLRGLLNAWPLYVLFVAVMVPLVWVCSAESRFQQTYPFVPFPSAERVRADLWKWELAYAAQFIGLEFFFRGFIVHGTKHRFGSYSVYVMTLPYVMIHFGKPIPEAVASIVAGVVLGYMSLATRSVWLGAALHIGVAWGMDCACLARRGLL